MVNGLKDHVVHLKSLVGLEGNAHFLESIGKTLHTNADRSVTRVAILSFFDRVEVPVDHPIQILSDAFCDFMQAFIVELPSFVAGELGQTDAG